jgi:hypothetical protein
MSETAKSDRWQEWLITLGLVALSAAAIWTVFGDDLRELIAGQPEREAAQKVQSP